MTGNRRGGEQEAGGASVTGRTMAFLAGGIGLLLLGLWLQVQPKLRYREVADETAAAKVLFPELSDAAKAASLEIVSFDEDTATLIPFKVVKSGGVWVLPAQQNYPADARDQLAAAATELIDRPILDVVSSSPGDHELYGVIEPDAEKVEVGATGVGQLVEIRDGSGNKLARLIVGKEDKRPGGAANPGRALRFVRKAGQYPVYRVEIDTSKFTTKFDDWIDKDLLKLSPWDIRRVTIDDSTSSFEVDPGSGGLAVSQDRKSRIELAYDDREAKWSLLKLEKFSAQGEPEEQLLGDGEELASSRLNDLRNALGDLTIVDVDRKPTGLSADLKTEEAFTGDQEAVLSLAQLGFFPFQSGEVLSSSGETVIGMKDGVEYLLRFGNPTTVAANATGAGESGENETETSGRYLFVLARLNEELLEKPEPKPLPEVPAVPAEPGASDEADAPGDQVKAEDKDQDIDDAKNGKPEQEGSAAEALAQADEAEAKAQAALEDRRRVERENRLAQEEYEEKMKAAQKRVRELNNRFADWYYVVSDAEYAKIRLSGSELIQATPADEAAAAPTSDPAP